MNPPTYRMVMEFNSTKNYTQIRKLITVLGQDFSTSKDNNKRKGGLLGLAATSIGLGKVLPSNEKKKHLSEIKLNDFLLFDTFPGH